MKLRDNLQRIFAYLLLGALVLALHVLAKAAPRPPQDSTPLLSQPCYVGVEAVVRWPGIYGFEAPPTLERVIRMAGGLLQDLPIVLPLNSNHCACSNMITVSSSSPGKAVITLRNIDAFKRITLGLKIDLNGEPASALVAIPGIGKSTAKAIVAYRERRGPIRSLTDLATIPGIGPKTVEMVAKFVTLEAEGCRHANL